MKLTSQSTLRALMAQRGLSMSSLANRAGCSKSFIGHLCNGVKATCTTALAARIAESLAVPTELLFAPAARSGRLPIAQPNRRPRSVRVNR